MAAENSDFWRECANYLIRTGILDQQHRVIWQSSNISDFVQVLRDGVLLCQLANRLSKGSVDMRCVNLRPQLSQFLCLQNISLFLGAAQTVFGLSADDLFDPGELYKVSNFAKVLTTLSKLSNSPLAIRCGIQGFAEPDENSPSDTPAHHNYYNDEIYKHLEEEAETKEIEEEVYDHVSDEEGAGKIYDHIIYQKRPDKFKEEEFKPKDKREHCIKELLDTEKNYVDALNMMLQKFLNPLKEVLNPDDHNIVFMNLQELAQINTAFQSELSPAIRLSVGINTNNRASVAAGEIVRIGEVFQKWKEKFTCYAEYCAYLPRSQSRIEKISLESGTAKQKIVECQNEVNGGKFRLQDLLSVPVQRILKYHLLLKELVKLTPKEHEDRPTLEVALEAMLDLSLYINEVKRDVETLSAIRSIQASITDLSMPENTELSDYGRLLKDGELKLSSHDDRKVKHRYVFIFDKVLMICKASRGNLYSYKNALVLSDYQVEDSDSNNNKSVIKWNYTWSLVHTQGQNVFTMYAKSQEIKEKWIMAIEKAHDNVLPRALLHTDHSFALSTFPKPTECSRCQKLLKGMFHQGYKCQKCSIGVHKQCIAECYNWKCGKPRIPERVRQMPRRWQSAKPGSLSGDFSCGQLVRAVKSYQGNNGGPDFLAFEENDVIEILDSHTELEGWYQGRVLNTDRIGLFPAELVKKQRTSMPADRFDTWGGQPGRHRNSQPEFSSPMSVKRRSVTSQPAQSQLSQAAIPSPSASAGNSYINLELQCYPWYAGSTSRDAAENHLNGLHTGTFLVRYSEKQNQNVISISHQNEVKHVKIESSTQGYYLDKSHYFNTIVELIEFYQTNSLQESFQALDTTLTVPFKLAFINFAVAIHDFEASQPNMMSLQRGDKLMILSKNGADRGWWKGKVDGKIGYFPLAYVQEADGNWYAPEPHGSTTSLNGLPPDTLALESPGAIEHRRQRSLPFDLSVPPAIPEHQMSGLSVQ